MQMIQVTKEKYEEMKHKAEEFDRIIEVEGLTKEELERLMRARQTPLLTKKEFIKKHSDLNN